MTKIDGQIRVRLGCSMDLPEVYALDGLAPGTWSEVDWARRFKSSGRCLYVVEVEDGCSVDLAGFALLKLELERVIVSRILVSPSFRRIGLASVLLAKSEERRRGNRKTIECMVPEGSLDVQLLLRARGYKCIEIERGKDGGPGCYGFAKRRQELTAADRFMVFDYEGRVISGAE